MYRRLVAQGIWEASGALSFGLMVAGAQFLFWAIVQRRVLLSRRPPVRGSVTARPGDTTRPA
jgi:hypothetical protein